MRVSRCPLLRFQMSSVCLAFSQLALISLASWRWKRGVVLLYQSDNALLNSDVQAVDRNRPASYADQSKNQRLGLIRQFMGGRFSLPTLDPRVSARFRRANWG